MSDDLNALVARLQTYAPFLQDMIGNLRTGMPQHTKLVSLHNMITDKKKKFKYDTLKKCEEVIKRMKQSKNISSFKQPPKTLPLPPRSPSPVPTIRSPDTDNWESSNTFAEDRYERETPSIYSSIAATISKPKNLNIDLIPKMDMSKPPISVADLDLLNSDDCATSVSVNSASGAKDKKHISSAKSSSSKVSVRTDLKDSKSSKARSENVVKETNSTFGSMLSSIDDQLVITDRKKRRDSKDCKDGHKSVKSNSNGNPKCETISRPSTSETATSKAADDRPVRLADKYNPKPRAKSVRTAEMMKEIGVVDKILKEMERQHDIKPVEEPELEKQQTPPPAVEPPHRQQHIPTQITSFNSVKSPSQKRHFQAGNNLNPATGYNENYNHNYRIPPQHNAFPPPQAKAFTPFEPVHSDYDISAHPPVDFYPTTPNPYCHTPQPYNVPPPIIFSPPYEQQQPMHQMHIQNKRNFSRFHENENLYTYKHWREEKKLREVRDPRENRDPRDHRDPRENRDPREKSVPHENRDPRESRDPRENRDPRDPRENRDPRDPRENRSLRDPREKRDSHDTRDPRLRREDFQRAQSRGRNSRSPESTRKSTDVSRPRVGSSEKDEVRVRSTSSDRDRCSPQKARDRLRSSAREIIPIRSKSKTRHNDFTSTSKAALKEKCSFWKGDSLQYFKIPKKTRPEDNEQKLKQDSAVGGHEPHSAKNEELKDTSKNTKHIDQEEEAETLNESIDHMDSAKEGSDTSGGQDIIKVDEKDTPVNNTNEDKSNDKEILVDKQKTGDKVNPVVKEIPPKVEKNKEEVTEEQPEDIEKNVNVQVSPTDETDTKKATTSEPSCSSEMPNQEQLAKILETIKEQKDSSTSTAILSMISMLMNCLTDKTKDVPKQETEKKEEEKMEDDKENVDVSEIAAADKKKEVVVEEDEETTPDEDADDDSKDEEYQIEENKNKAKKPENKGSKKNAQNKSAAVKKTAGNQKQNEDVHESVGERIKNRKRSNAENSVPIETERVTRQRVANMRAPPVKKPRKNELDKLHDDIKESLGEGVLSTSSRRACTMTSKDTEKEKVKVARVVLEKLPEAKASNVAKEPNTASDNKMNEKQSEEVEQRKKKQKNQDPIEKDGIDNLPKKRKVSKAAEKTLIDDDAESVNSELSRTNESMEYDTNDDTVDDDIKKTNSKKKRKASAWATGVIKKRKPAKKSTGSDESMNEPDLVDPDKEYYLKSADANYCKLCNYSGKAIVYHYMMSHPENDIYISRLSPKDTELAISESKLANLDDLQLSEEDARTRRKFKFRCRFCKATYLENANFFYDHLTSHTGEHRFQCTECNYRNNNRRNLKLHVNASHPAVDPNNMILLEDSKPNYPIVLGYLCSDCNFLQLHREAIEQHIYIYHLGDDAHPITINMSLQMEDTDKAPTIDKPTIEKRVTRESLKNAISAVGKNKESSASTTQIVSSEEINQSTAAVEETKKKPASELNLTAFLCDESAIEEEENLEEKRLEKMKEIQSTIKTKRTSFVNTLVSRLENQLKMDESVDSVRNEEKKSEEEQICSESIAQVTNMKTKKPLFDIAVKIKKECVEMDEAKETDESMAETSIEADQLQDSNMRKESKNYCTSTPKSVEVPKIQSSINQTVNRLQGYLSKVTPFELVKVVPKDESVNFSVSIIHATKKKVNDIEFICNIPSCIFRTSSRKIFGSHCKFTHKNEYYKLSCTTCIETNGQYMSIVDIFKHLCSHVYKKDVDRYEIQIKQELEELDDANSDQDSSVSSIFGIKIASVTSLAPPKSDALNDVIAVSPTKSVLPESPLALREQSPTSPVPQLTKTSETSPKSAKLSKGTLTTLKGTSSNTPDSAVPTTAICKVVIMSPEEIRIPRKTSEVRRKWLNSPKILEILLKCPEPACSFATNIENEFDLHLLNEHTFPSGALLPCHYCNYKMEVQYFKLHLLMRHNKSNNGCAYCLYRAISPEYVKWHQKFEHKGKEYSCLKYSESALILSADASVKYKIPEVPPISRFLRPYVCGCKKEYRVLRNFETHTKSCAISKPWGCGLCSFNFKFHRSINRHFQTKHQLHIYHCRYCFYGNFHIHDLLNHMVTEHSNYEFRVVCRYAKDGSVDLVEDDKIYDKLICLNYEDVIKDPVNVNIESLCDIGSDKDADDTLEDDESEDVEGQTFSGSLLFVCKCGEKSENSTAFKNHLASCIAITQKSNSQKPFDCYHCNKSFKNAPNLVEHIRIHGANKISCSLCTYKHPQVSSMRTHMKSKHKISFCNILPVNPKQQNFDMDEFIATPNQRRLSNVANFVQTSPTKESLQLKQLSNDPIMYTCSPEEINKLPPMPVYRHEIECSICQYSTKVRMNLIRHMNLHKNNAEVTEIPTTAPVNPVPCLQNKELMFDKMRNLANSSHAKKVETKVEQSKKEVDLNIPSNIPLNKRYVCGASNCNYLCLEESMLRHHLQALHGHEQNYTCAHCNEDFSSEKYPINVDNILRHLRLHDNLLYKCAYCKFLNSAKNKVERHCSDKHADKTCKVLTLREETDEAPVESKEKKTRSWRCGMCKSRYLTKEAIISHVENKHGIDSQYKCSYCNYKSLERGSFAEHFKSKHEGCREDVIVVYFKEDAVKPPPVEPQPQFDTTPLWVMNKQNNVKHIRGILLEDQERIPKKGAVKTPSKAEEVDKTKKSASKAEEVDKVKKTASKAEEVDKMKKTASKAEEVDKMKKTASKSEEVEKTKKVPVKSSTKTTDHGKKESMSSNKSSTVDEDKTKVETKKIGKRVTNLDLSIDAVARGSATAVGDEDSDPDILHYSDDSYEFSEIEEKLGSLKTMPIEKLIASNFMGTYGPFGKPAFEAFLCPLCAIYQTPEMNDFKYHLYDELEYKLFGCKHCSHTECKKKKLEMHCKEVHGEFKLSDIIVLDSQPQIEEWVKQVTTYQKRIIEFMNDDGGEHENIVESDTEEPPATSTVDQIFKCKYCVYETKTQSALKTHDMRHWVQKPFGCSLCKFTGVVRSEMMKHGRKVHPGEKMTIVTYVIENPTIVPITNKFVNKYPFLCTICNVRLKKDFEQHMEKVHSKQFKDTARKSTSKPYQQTGFSYYGTKPDISEEDIQKTVLHLNDNDNSTMTVEEYAKANDVFPKVTLVDMNRHKT